MDKTSLAALVRDLLLPHEACHVSQADFVLQICCNQARVDNAEEFPLLPRLSIGRTAQMAGERWPLPANSVINAKGEPDNLQPKVRGAQSKMLASLSDIRDPNLFM